jgi:hypothetical protein
MPEVSKRIVPEHRTCGAPEVHQRLLENRQYQQNQIDIAQFTSRFMLWGGNRRVGVVTIPTVVHVVFSNDDENISDEQVQSQIDALNRDYRALNADKADVPGVWASLVADVQVQFALAKKDPDGAATSGTTRTETTSTGF